VIGTTTSIAVPTYETAGTLTFLQMYEPAAHEPPLQTSLPVHGSPSSQGVPSVDCGLLHRPVAGLQTPGSWHWSVAGQFAGVPEEQAPPWQVSDSVHRSPSSHTLPLGLAGLEQTPVPTSQTPTT
jgi:hypothetical protein